MGQTVGIGDLVGLIGLGEELAIMGLGEMMCVLPAPAEW